VELLHIEFPLLPGSAPDNGSPLGVHLQHVAFRAFAVPAKDTAENHRDIAHQIYRIIVHDDQPGMIERILLLGLRRLQKARIVHGMISQPGHESYRQYR